MRARDYVPAPFRPAIRAVFRALRGVTPRLLDVCHKLANAGQSALPPPGLRTVGAGDFHAAGVHNVRNIKQLTTLDGKHVLEIGCGSGRNAIVLTSYEVQYHGFDIYRPYITWCTEHI